MDFVDIQNQIITALGVDREFDASREIEKRTEFLAKYLSGSRSRTLVLGISGGVDSLLAGILAQHAVSRLRVEGYDARFIAVRLPYGTQADEQEASKAIQTIEPDQVVTVDIKPATDMTMVSLKNSGLTFKNEAHEDFILGNIKARQRMIVQYAIAGAKQGLVIGTDHAAEAVMGFFTKHGDGAADVVPLEGLIKRRIRAMAADLGAPGSLVNKIPTADLETLTPQKPDEVAYGVTYNQIDDFLEGKKIEDIAAERIIRFYNMSIHKRHLPVGPSPI